MGNPKKDFPDSLQGGGHLEDLSIDGNIGKEPAEVDGGGFVLDYFPIAYGPRVSFVSMVLNLPISYNGKFLDQMDDCCLSRRTLLRGQGSKDFGSVHKLVKNCTL
jgi:hypothetical protein